MIVGQDWTSEEQLRGPVNDHSVMHGYDPDAVTNINLQRLLKEHLGKEFSDVYATNAFPFIKPGGISAPIPAAHMRLAVKEFLLPQIEIVEPQIVICLGLSVFNALRESCGHNRLRTLDDAVKSPFQFRASRIVAVAHTGTNNRKRRGFRIEEDWGSIGRSLVADHESTAVNTSA